VSTKRNTIDCTFSNVTTDTEAKEIVVQAKQFCVEVKDSAALRSCPPPRLNSAGQQRNVRDEQQTQDFHLQEITQLARSVGAGVLFRSPMVSCGFELLN
jgi:hypothetical protein